MRRCADCNAMVKRPRKRCEACARKHQNALKAQWRKQNPEAYSAIKRRYRADNKEVERNRHLLRTFGISLADFKAILERQGGRCDICRSETPGGKGSWHVDHDHATGKVRGLLCLKCNALLGHARDSELTLEAAIMYLRRHALGIELVRCG